MKLKEERRRKKRRRGGGKKKKKKTFPRSFVVAADANLERMRPVMLHVENRSTKRRWGKTI